MFLNAGGKQRPYVTVFVTMSADGKISSRTGESRLSCPEDKRRLHSLRAQHQAIMVGANTVLRDNPRLTVRYVKGKNPVRVVVDGFLRVTPDLRVFRVAEAPTVLVTSDAHSSEDVREFEDKGVNVIKLPDQGGYRIKLSDVLAALLDLGIKSVLVEGGGSLIWGLFSEGLVDEYRVTISPYIIGGRDAVTPVEGEGFGSLSEWVRLELINKILCGCGNEIHLIYRVKNTYQK